MKTAKKKSERHHFFRPGLVIQLFLRASRVQRKRAILTVASIAWGSLSMLLLLAFGEADLRVPLAHGERMRSALKEAGNAPEWVTYAGEGHGWHLLENKVDFAQRIERFLARHLQGPAR